VLAIVKILSEYTIGRILTINEPERANGNPVPKQSIKPQQKATRLVLKGKSFLT